ncbi:MAG: dihydroorotate dehydrogenase-like protein [Chitinivibrionales bacterium]|nr:dihydroorotate dehydrogenase-like protein [Chitinivibrionales bacterium]
MDLNTRYMGLALSSPLVGSASPLWRHIDRVKELEDNGAGAVVLDSLFEEQVSLEQRTLNKFLLQGTEHFSEALTYFPDTGPYRFAPDQYLERLERIKGATDFPVIASLNGISPGGWLTYAAEMEQAGADGIELNIYYLPADPSMSSEEVENNYVELVREIKKHIKIPLAVKLSPFLTSTPWTVSRLTDAGADALVMFNRFYQLDFDLKSLSVKSNLQLSTSQEMRLRIRWIALLYKKIPLSMALTGGVHTSNDLVKSIAAGATVAMTTSSLLKNGIAHCGTLLKGLVEWMQHRDYDSVDALRGVLSHDKVAEPAAFERANYMHVLASWVPEEQDELTVKSHR